MSREVIIVGKGSGSARVSVLTKGGRVGYKAKEFDPIQESGYLNALDTVTFTLEQSVEGNIGDVTIFTLGNVANAVARYHKCRTAVELLKLEAEEEMQKVFELFVESKTTEMTEEEQEIWSRFIPAEYASREDKLIKEIRSIYTGDYLDKMQTDLDLIAEEAKEKGVVPRMTATDRFKERIIKAHRDAWDLVPEFEGGGDLKIEDAF